MKTLGTTVAIVLIAGVLIFGRTAMAREQGAMSEESRFDTVELQQGQLLFRKNCAVCHGWNAEGTVENWKERDEEGKLPPPPLNGSAHTWHHSTQVLHRLIRDGTQNLGGSMPPWKEKLSDEEILLVIQWLTSLWPDDVYQAWVKRTH